MGPSMAPSARANEKAKRGRGAAEVQFLAERQEEDREAVAVQPGAEQRAPRPKRATMRQP